MQRDVTLIALFAAMVFLFLCNFMSLGIVGEFFSHLMFGLFGVLSYLLPVIIFALYLYYILMVEKDDGIGIKILAILGLLLIICVFTELIGADMASQTGYDPAAIYTRSAENHSGGGILGGTIAYVLYQLLKGFGTILVLLVGAAACVYALVQKSILEMARDTAMDARLHHLERLEEEERYRQEHPEEFEEEYEDSEEEYGDPQTPSHYEESRQRYQELQRERKARIRQTREQQRAARRQTEDLNVGNMWNTDLSADAAFMGTGTAGQEGPEAPDPLHTPAGGDLQAEDALHGTVGTDAQAEHSATGQETGVLQEETAAGSAAEAVHSGEAVQSGEAGNESAAAAQEAPSEAPPIRIDPQAAILEHKKALEEQQRQEELQRRLEEEEARRQAKEARQYRRNQESLHELYAEDYLDEAEDEAAFAGAEGTAGSENAGLFSGAVGAEEETGDTAGAGEGLAAAAGIVTAAAIAGSTYAGQVSASARTASHAGGMLAENILADPGAEGLQENGFSAASGREEEYIPEIYEEVPGIRVIKRDSAGTEGTADAQEERASIPAAQETTMPAYAKPQESVASPAYAAQPSALQNPQNAVPAQTGAGSVAVQETRMPESVVSDGMADTESYLSAEDRSEQTTASAGREEFSQPAVQQPASPVREANSAVQRGPYDSPAQEMQAQERVLPDIPVHTERENVPPAADAAPAGQNSFAGTPGAPEAGSRAADMLSNQTSAPQEEKREAPVRREYVFPPISLLHKGEGTMADTDEELRETAQLLQTTLRNFGVKITITDISQGPSVTRYEMLPEMGVKVSKIVSLADDIKLALAATDIRIEAPIPGKSAIGIEVPNKEAAPVALRDIVDTDEFRAQKSKLAFAVGKDIGGKPVFGDIAKMPHVLIAGATGSGKSVCINTIIMSLLFHAKPEEVKLIMIDPKVVELSVYNGIPHLMIPVVTNPQKAAAALNWGVAEMEARYRAFADARVRDIKGYNALVRQHQQIEGGSGNEAVMHFMPQLVIIVDELADLMMVAKNDVETAICRLAQLARAAGIHLIIATQRPSVDVITGLIKANMPSRIAFRVSSGVDSRTILDMNGAEKLLGKGDMLFFPQGLPKPNRVQGCFVSDDEVTDVVNFLVTNNPVSDEESRRHQQEIDAIEAGSGAPSSSSAGTESTQESDVDELFASAGRFIIERGNASIGLLQRKYRIGFNRAARIMDQLCEKGVVGEAVGTKARAILMTPEQFESYCSENGYESVD